MDKHSIFKFFTDNTDNKPKAIQAANLVVSYGDNATINIGHAVDDNEKLSLNSKKRVHDLIRTLEGVTDNI